MRVPLHGSSEARQGADLMAFPDPEKALIFRITHLENVPWILRHGLHCRGSSLCDPNFCEIGNPDLISKRVVRAVPVAPGGTLSDYVPFYFTPFSPMLYNIKTGYQGMKQTPMPEIAILVASLLGMSSQGIQYVFTDRHAYLEAANFYTHIGDLDEIDWKVLQARDFRRSVDDPGKIERYQAEALIHLHLPVTSLVGIACYGTGPATQITERCGELNLELKAVARPDWYL